MSSHMCLVVSDGMLLVKKLSRANHFYGKFHVVTRTATDSGHPLLLEILSYL